MERTCLTCKRLLPEAAFYKNGRNDCKECRKAAVYKRRAQIRAEGKCIECRTPVASGPLCRACQNKHLDRYHANREAYGEKQRQRRQRLKLEAFKAYGGAICGCCGEQHIEFLSIDHIAGDGAAHRRQMLEEKGWNTSYHGMSGTTLYLWLKQNKYPPGFQVLCMNCNFAQGRFNYCPHNKAAPTNVG